MLKIDPNSRSLLSLGRRTLEPAPLFGRYPVADLIANSSDVFFADLGRAFFLLGRDVPVDSTGARRADLLLADPEGRLFIGRLQHNDRPVDLVEALEDAGRVTSWGPQRILGGLDAERRELFQKAFLQVPLDRLNAEQGVLLLAESYDLDTLAAAGWLRARYGVRIDCYQLRLSKDSLTQIDYLSCHDLSGQASRVYQRRKSSEPDGAPWPARAVPDISDRAPESEPKVEAPAAEPQPAPPPPKPPSPLEAEVQAALGKEPVAEQARPFDEMTIPGDLALEDDPLADVIAGIEAANQPQTDAPPAADRRVADRSRDYQARRLRLDYFGRLLGARLVDFSSKGLGVEALSPLPVGAEIGISGEIISGSRTLGIEGRAKVEHCRSTEDGVCRIGFSLGRAKISRLDDPETFDRR